MATLKVKRGSGTPTGLTAWEMAYDVTNGRFCIGNTTGSPIIVGISGANNVVTSFNGATGAITGVNSWNELSGTINVSYVGSISASTGINVNSLVGLDPPYSTSVTITNIGVVSFNGSTGAIQGVSSVNGFTGGITFAAGTGITFSTSGKSITITNEGVRSFNGSTGAIVGVAGICGATGAVNFTAGSNITLTRSGNTFTIAATGLAITGAENTFSSLQTFSAGITASGITTGICTADYYRQSSVGFETKTAGFTFAAADNGKIFLMGNTSNAIIYFPTGLPVGFKSEFIRRTTGSRVRFFESGTTIESKSGNAPEMSDSGNKGEHVTIIQVASNVFSIYGDLL